MVQIWLPDAIKGDKEDEPIAYGLVVGDGSQILTAFSYEDNIPDDLLVGVPGEQKYHATIQAIDPQTSVTLLKVENVTYTATIADNNTGRH